MAATNRAERRRKVSRLKRLLEGLRARSARGPLAEISPVERDPHDIEDDAADELRHAVESALAQMKSETLRSIEDAIERLEAGRYGLCSDCGLAIPGARLRVLPFAALCRHCQAEREAECSAASVDRGVATVLGAA
jgi:DnaK suppressor protein